MHYLSILYTVVPNLCKYKQMQITCFCLFSASHLCHSCSVCKMCCLWCYFSLVHLYNLSLHLLIEKMHEGAFHLLIIVYFPTNKRVKQLLFV